MVIALLIIGLLFGYGIIVTIKQAKQEERKVTPKEIYRLLGLTAVFAIPFIMAYIIQLKNENEDQQKLQYEIEQCLNKNRLWTYKKCKAEAINKLNFMAEMADRDSDTPSIYR